VFAEGCRDIVRKILLGEEQYWFAEFSEERFRDTASTLHKLIGTCLMGKDAVEEIQALVLEKSAPFDENTRWLIMHLIAELVQNRLASEVPELNTCIQSVLMKAWSETNLDPLHLKQHNLNSVSEWDRYIRSLTPDLPTFLSDFVAVELLGTRRFQVFWQSVCTNLESEQQKQLFGWYETAALVLDGIEIRLSGER
jgi:hypothetical protein